MSLEELKLFCAQRFEYSLSASTVLPVPIDPHHKNVQPVTYLDRGQWYELKVGALYPKLCDEQEQMYFSLKLEFVDKQMEEVDMILWRRWLALHSCDKVLEVDPTSVGLEKILYDSHEHNHVGVVVRSGDEMRFRLRFNCVSSQLPLLLAQHSNSHSTPAVPVFRLVVQTYSDITGLKFDTVACLIKLFWQGTSAHQYQMDRYRFVRASSEALDNLASFHQSTHTVLTRMNRTNYSTSKSPSVERMYPNILKMLSQQTEPKVICPIAPMPIYPTIPSVPECEDKRKLLCILKAPNGPTVSLTKGHNYQLRLKPLNLDPNEHYRSSIRLSLGQAQQVNQCESELLTNLSSILGCDLLEPDYSHSDLDESVLDVRTGSRQNLHLIWNAAAVAPSREVKLSFKFNCLTSDFRLMLNRSSVELFLLIETFSMKDNALVEQSHCQITIEKTDQRKSSANSAEVNEFVILKCGAIPKSTPEISTKMTIYIFYMYMNDKNYTTMPFPLTFSTNNLTMERLRDKLFLPLVQKYVGNQSLNLSSIYYRDFANAFCKEASIKLQDSQSVDKVFKAKCGYKLELEPVKSSKPMKSSSFNLGNLHVPSTSKAQPTFKFHCPAPVSSTDETNYNLYISECFLQP